MTSQQAPAAARISRRPHLFAAGWDAAVLLVVGAGLLLPGLGRVPFRRAEIYFADAARSMVESGDWLIPHFRGVPFFDKPILTYWLMAGSFTELGFSAGSARIPSILAALAVLLLTLWLGRMLWSDDTGLAAGLVLAATPSFMDFGRLGMSDALLTLWSTLTVALAIYIHRTERTFWPTIALGITLGLGFLTKGPIAWITPGLGVVCAMWFRRERRPALSPIALAFAGLAALIIALGWFAAVYLRMGWEPLVHFFLKENFARFSGASYNVGNPIWFFPQTYLHEGAPWSIFLPIAAFCLTWRTPDKDSSGCALSGSHSQPLINCRWLLAWICLDTLVLSASRGKLGYYLLPLYPAASLLVARYFVTARWARVARCMAALTLIVTALLLVALPFAIVRAPAGWRPVGVQLVAVIAVLIASAAVCVAAAIRPRPLRMLVVLAAVSIVLFMIGEGVIFPTFYEAQPNRAIAEHARQERASHGSIRVAARQDFVGISRELLFHARLDLHTGADLVALARSSDRYLLIVEPEEAATVEGVPHLRKIAEYRYLPSTIFSRRGLVSGVEPKQLVLFANFD